MTDDNGALSIDFMIGFTIFLIAFIWVATMVPNLFLGVSSHTIDYDAVAYRTGVILAEDPGATTPGQMVPWEFQPDKRDVERFGLALSKDTPNILDENKLNRFFCATAFTPPLSSEDLRKRAIFGDYPYRFNVSLRIAGDEPQTMGEIIPDNFAYGTIRRDVKVKHFSNATIGAGTINANHYFNSENVSSNRFTLIINSSELLGVGFEDFLPFPDRISAYRINPSWDRITINITDLEITRPVWNPAPPPVSSPSDTNVTVAFYQKHYGDSILYPWQPATAYNKFLFIDGSDFPVTFPLEPPAGVRNNLSMVFEPGFFAGTDPDGQIFINMTFGMATPMPFLNNTATMPFDYNYSRSVTQPFLEDAVMEVATW